MEDAGAGIVITDESSGTMYMQMQCLTRGAGVCVGLKC